MSGFINTTRKQTINSLIEGFKEKLKNPYYIFLDRTPTPVIYYNQNTTKSTLDQGSKLAYANIGDNSPIKYNKIVDFYLYGIDRLEIDLDNGDFGLESNPIEGEAIVLPNTIIPIANDYFSIEYLNKKILFKVTGVTQDTIENDSNLYKISFRLDKTTQSEIDAQVSDEFTMLINNVGTQFNTVIRSNDYKFIEIVQDITDRLKKYYTNLFYSDRVQTFIFNMNNHNFYDPYIIEFIIRNRILTNGQEYFYISHQLNVDKTFAIEYDKTFLRAIELGCIDDKFKITSTAELITDQLSILSSRLEDYYVIDYKQNNSPYYETIYNFDIDIINKVKDNLLFNIDDYRNIIIKYFLHQEIDQTTIDCIEKIDFEQNINLFYNIPIIIYILEKRIMELLNK